MVYGVGKSEIYYNSWEHLEDELRRLDLIIHLHVLKLKHQFPTSPFDQWKGLVLSNDEITGLLDNATDNPIGETLINFHDPRIDSLNNELKKLEFKIQKKRVNSLKEGIKLSLPQLSNLFNLSSFEEKCVVICLAPELHRKYEKFYAYLQDDVTCKKPSVELLMKLICHTTEEKLKARLAFDDRAPLLKYKVLKVDNSINEITPLISRSLKLDDRIVNFLLGFDQMDTRLESIARVTSPRTKLILTSTAEQVRHRLVRTIQSFFKNMVTQKKSLIFYFHGPYGAGKEALANTACSDLRMPLVIGDVEKMAAGDLPLEDTIWLTGRETVLRQAALCLENFDCLLDDFDKYRTQINYIFETTGNFTPLAFLLGERPWKPQRLPDKCVFLDIEFFIADDKARKEFWEELSRNICPASDMDFGELAGKFRFTPGQIRDSLIMAKNLSSWRSPENEQINMEDLHTACRAQANQKLGKLAQKIEPRYGWEDIILPPDQMNQLKEICSHVKYRYVVYGEWGFGRKHSWGKGFNALFSGPPGTGKTMAAEIIANDLKLDLYRIDLSQVVSKYIGETEKNLQKIFQEAETSSAILFFDEADALFGKRSDVKDAHDRYANIEVAYLLQKMEEYEGITILATNLRNNMDEAFVRRIQFTVEFPFPDAEYRSEIWQAMFPKDSPRRDDVDLPFLANRFEFSGGNIKNIVLRAAFFAAESSVEIGMAHIIRATKRELQKMGSLFIQEDFGEYCDYLSQEPSGCSK